VRLKVRWANAGKNVVEVLPLPSKIELSALERDSKKPRFLVDADLGSQPLKRQAAL